MSPDTVEQCRSCRAPIVWLTTEKGHLIPVDAETYIHGDGVSTHGVDRFSPLRGHVSHFATCPDATKWRKRR